MLSWWPWFAGGSWQDDCLTSGHENSSVHPWLPLNAVLGDVNIHNTAIAFAGFWDLKGTISTGVGEELGFLQEVS